MQTMTPRPKDPETLRPSDQATSLLAKMNYKGQKRIAVLNAEENFLGFLKTGIPDVIINTEIDQRFPYEFILIFITDILEVEPVASAAIHNLTADGILWFAFPKKSSKRFSSDIDQKHGWEFLIERGFDIVRMVTVNEDWSAIRFRNVRYIRSSRNRGG